MKSTFLYIEAESEAIFTKESLLKTANLFIKRMADILFSGIGIIIVSPILLISIIAIKATMPGPIFFHQERAGKMMKPFDILKLRTMKVDDEAEKELDVKRDAERITPVGKILRRTKIEGNDIIGQTTESLVNKGFREVSPIHFFTGRDLISKRTDLIDIEGGMNLLAVNQGQEAFRVA